QEDRYQLNLKLLHDDEDESGRHQRSVFPASGTKRAWPNRVLPNSPINRCVAVSTMKSANARPPATLMRGAFLGLGSSTWYTLYSSGSPWTSDTRSILLFQARYVPMSVNV